MKSDRTERMVIFEGLDAVDYKGVIAAWSGKQETQLIQRGRHVTLLASDSELKKLTKKLNQTKYPNKTNSVVAEMAPGRTKVFVSPEYQAEHERLKGAGASRLLLRATPEDLPYKPPR